MNHHKYRIQLLNEFGLTAVKADVATTEEAQKFWDDTVLSMPFNFTAQLLIKKGSYWNIMKSLRFDQEVWASA